MTHKTTVIRKIKRPEKGIHHRPAYDLSEYDHGLWLYSPKGTIFRGQTPTWMGECLVGGDGGRPAMHLIPKGKWWTAAWYGEHISVDICTPPTLIKDEWHYGDLELDLVGLSDGCVRIDDEDEFLAACAQGLISPSEATQARAATTEVEGYLRRQTEPFSRLGWDKLDEASGLCLPPIRELRHISIA